MIFQILLMCHSRITIFSKLCYCKNRANEGRINQGPPAYIYIGIFCVIHISNIPGNQLFHWMAFCKCCTIHFCGFNVLQKFIRILCLALNLTNLLSCIFWCIIHSFFFSEKKGNITITRAIAIGRIESVAKRNYILTASPRLWGPESP